MNECKNEVDGESTKLHAKVRLLHLIQRAARRLLRVRSALGAPRHSSPVATSAKRKGRKVPAAARTSTVFAVVSALRASAASLACLGFLAKFVRVFGERCYGDLAWRKLTR
jgi:hypothetical protein